PWAGGSTSSGARSRTGPSSWVGRSSQTCGSARCSRADMDTCEARVWDNGDMTDCGKPVVRLGRCAGHIESEVAYLKGRIAEHEQGIVQARLRIADLLGEVRA